MSSATSFLRFQALPGQTPLVAAAIAIGLVIALLPLSTAAFMFALGALVVLTVIEPRNAVIILLLVAPLKTLVETEASFSLPLDPGQLALLFAIGVWVIVRIVQRQPLYLRGHAVQIPLFLFVLVALLSLVEAPSPATGLAETLKWIEIILLISFSLALYRRDEAHWLVFALVLAGGVQAAAGLYEFFGGSGADHLRILDGQHFRAFGSFGQPNPFGAFMGITLPLALSSTLAYAGQLWQRIANRNWRTTIWQEAAAVVFYVGISGLILGGLITSWSRGAWMGFASAVVVMLLMIPRSVTRGLVLLAAILILGVMAWNNGLVPSTISARMTSFVGDLTAANDARGLKITDDNYAVIERAAHWQVGAMIAQDYPWLGVGFGNYEAAYPQYALINWPIALGHAHNYYLNLLAEVGLFGLVAYLLAWGAVVVSTVKVWRRQQGIARAWSIALMGAWMYIAVHSVVDKLYVNNLFLHLGFMMGLLAVLSADSSS